MNLPNTHNNIEQNIKDAEAHYLAQNYTEAIDSRLIEKDEKNKNKQILTACLIAGLAIMTSASLAVVLFDQEVYAPTARRGYFQAATEGTIFVDMNPTASPYMIVVCDDVAQLETVYANWQLRQQYGLI